MIANDARAMRRVVLPIFFILLLTGCFGGGGSSSSGTAPSISNLSYFPTSAYVNDGGGQTDIIGTFDFIDPDGNLNSVTIIVQDSGGQIVQSETITITGVSGLTSGTIQGEFTITTTTAGNFTVQIYVTDTSGLRSNTIEFIFKILERIWSPVSLTGAPEARTDHTAVWTGSEMIIWGGDDGNSIAKNSGGRYDQANNTWMPTTTNQAPSAREQHTAIWAGAEMIIWGGFTGAFAFDTLGDGARYDPQTDTWASISAVNQPSKRVSHTSIWTGTEMIIWGGFSCVACANGELGTGARYNPSTDTWTSITTINAPAARGHHSAIWTGSKMIVWGGQNDGGNATATLLNTGGIYDPATDTWTNTTLVGAPPPTFCHVGIQTTSEMIIFGGQTNTDLACGLSSTATVYQFDVIANIWSAMNDAPLSSSLAGPAAIWSGNRMITWFDNVGGRYDPVTDIWQGVSTDGAPSTRRKHTLVWTGTNMIVWGGDFAGPVGTGAIYNPQVDPIQ